MGSNSTAYNVAKSSKSALNEGAITGDYKAPSNATVLNFAKALSKTIPSNVITNGMLANFGIPTSANLNAAGFPMNMPESGASLAQRYGPFPFSLEANTQFPMQRQQLTYFNPYNTNPYLPTANPFALIANSQNSGS